jgi:hypothetical protein
MSLSNTVFPLMTRIHNTVTMRNRQWFCLYILLSITAVILLIYGLLYVWEYPIDCQPHNVQVQSRHLSFHTSSCEVINPWYGCSYPSCEELLSDGTCCTSTHYCVVSHQYVTTINMTLVAPPIPPLPMTYQHSQPNHFIHDQDLLQSWNQTLVCYYTHSHSQLRLGTPSRPIEYLTWMIILIVLLIVIGLFSFPKQRYHPL